MEMIRKILKVICAVCFCWFLLPLSHFILNIGNITGMAVFAAYYFCIDRYEQMKKWLKEKWAFVLGKILITVCVLFLTGILVTAGVLSVKMLSSFNTAQEYNGETVIVLGCEVRKNTPSRMLTERLRAAYAFLTDHSDAKCVLSGGQGSNENISEAEAMYVWLTENGIDAERLYLEDRSTSTKENLSFSKDRIEAWHLNPDVVIITSGFHEYRAGLIADTLDMNHKGYGSHTAWWLMPTFAVREMYGILYQYVTQ